MAANNSSINGLPGELWYKCYSYFTYDDVSRIRLVAKPFDTISRVCLNDGFRRAEGLHAKWLTRVKAQLPRRESERRNHRLARVADILAAVETRLSLLSMTYKKHVDAGLICFIPGKVLDEIFSVIRIVANNVNPTTEDRSLKPHEILQELRDISSMAIEHFDDKIAPALRERATSAFQTKAGMGMFMLNLGNIPFSGLRSMDSPIIRTVAAASANTPSTSAMSQAFATIAARQEASKNLSNIAAVENGASMNNGNVQLTQMKCDHLQRMHNGLQLVVTSHRSDIAQLRAGHKRHRERIFSQNRTILEQNHKISLLSKQLLEHETQMNLLKQEIREIKNNCSSIATPAERDEAQDFSAGAPKRRRKQSDSIDLPMLLLPDSTNDWVTPEFQNHRGLGAQSDSRGNKEGVQSDSLNVGITTRSMIRRKRDRPGDGATKDGEATPAATGESNGGAVGCKRSRKL